VIAILRPNAPNARIPASAVKIFVLQGAVVMASQIEDKIADDEQDDKVGGGPYITC
jgi:hypothetical protein